MPIVNKLSYNNQITYRRRLGGILSCAPDHYRGRDVAVCFAWKQVELGFFSPTSRLVEARQGVVHVALSQRLRQDEAGDGQLDVTDCVGSFYPKITIFSVLDHRDNLVFCLGL
jgi:hypothetical protein